jgi:D-sedoheptulose 7-phosphate isomerase
MSAGTQINRAENKADNLIEKEANTFPEDQPSAASYLMKACEESMAVKQAFFETNKETMLEVAQLMAQVFQKDGRVLIAGNGGSASDSQHFAGELVGRLLKERKPLAAIALSTDTSVLTAVGNDYGYDSIFSKQVEAIGREGDLFFAISTSGKSPNILKAVQSAQAKKMKVVALTGGTGGPLAEKANFHLNASVGRNSPRIQETHIAAIHTLIEIMDRFYLDLG